MYNVYKITEILNWWSYVIKEIETSGKTHGYNQHIALSGFLMGSH